MAVDTPVGAVPARLVSVRASVGPLLCVVAAALVAFAAMRRGGFFAPDYLTVGVAAFVATAGGLLLAENWRPSPLFLTAFAGLAALTAWTALSGSWSPDPIGANVATDRNLCYVAVLALFGVAAGNGRHASLLLRLIVLVLVGVCVVALLSRLRPSLVPIDATLREQSDGRLAYPITYWNGLGAVAAMAVAGCVAFAAERRHGRVVQALAAAGGVLAACTLYLTLSRGSNLALAGGLIAVLLLSPRRRELLVALAAVAVGAAVGILLLRTHPQLVDRPATVDAQERAGARALPEVFGAAAVAAALRLAIPPGFGRRRGGMGRTLMADRALATVVVVLVALALGGTYVALESRIEGGAATGATNLRSLVGRGYSDFMTPNDVPLPSGERRLTTSRTTRSDAYRVALDVFAAHPLKGHGAASYASDWMRRRHVDELAINAHSLELETAAELGIVGLAFLLALLGSACAGLRGLRLRRGALTRIESAGCGAILIVWLLHSALDWDWQLAGVTLPALGCIALLLVPRGGGRRRGAATRG